MIAIINPTLLDEAMPVKFVENAGVSDFSRPHHQTCNLTSLPMNLPVRWSRYLRAGAVCAGAGG